LGEAVSVHIFSRVLPPVRFNGGYVQATKSLRGNCWRVSAWVERRLPSGSLYHTRANTRMRRSEEAAVKTADEMAAFWAKDNPQFL
jgi:hypothetical protein